MPNNPCATPRRLSRLRAEAASSHCAGNCEQENHSLGSVYFCGMTAGGRQLSKAVYIQSLNGRFPPTRE